MSYYHAGQWDAHTEGLRTYTVTFHYTVTVEAADSEAAENQAAEELQGYLDDDDYRRRIVRDMAATVDHAGALH